MSTRFEASTDVTNSGRQMHDCVISKHYHYSKDRPIVPLGQKALSIERLDSKDCHSHQYENESQTRQWPVENNDSNLVLRSVHVIVRSKLQGFRCLSQEVLSIECLASTYCHHHQRENRKFRHAGSQSRIITRRWARARVK